MVLRRILTGTLLYWLVDTPAFGRAGATCKNMVAEHVERGMQCKQAILMTDIQAQEASLKPKMKQTIAEELASLDADLIAPCDDLLTSLLAARTNVTASLGWTIYFLAREPAVYARLRRYVLVHIGTRHDETQITS